jgi:hypothetical protein
MFQFAQMLQSKAKKITLRYMASYVFFGAVLGVGVWLFAPKLAPYIPGISSYLKDFAWWTAVPMLAVIAGMRGYVQGRLHSFDLQLEAQRTQCQIQIEKHLAAISQLLSTHLAELSSTSKSKDDPNQTQT